MTTVVDISENQKPLDFTGTLASTGAQAVLSDSSGATIYFPTNTGNCNITLPAPLAGLRYKFVASGVGAATSYTFKLTGAIGQGVILPMGTAAYTASTHATGVTNIISGAAANLLTGDYLLLTCDGTNWYYEARSSGAAAGWSTS